MNRLLTNSYKLIRSKTDWPASSPESGLLYWRERILFGILVVGILLGLVPYVFSLVLSAREGMWQVILATSLFFAWSVATVFVRRISFELRAWGFLIVVYILGMVLLIALGPVRSGILYLFTFSVVAGVLLGIKGVVGATVLDLIGLTVVGRLMATGSLGWENLGGPNVQQFTVLGINFIFLNLVATGSLAAILQGLEKSLRNEREGARQLEAANRRLETEVAERCRTEAALSLNELRYRSILETIREGYFELDLDGNLTFFNDALLEIVGMAREDLVDLNYRDFIPEPAASSLTQTARDIFDTGRPVLVVDYEFMAGDGSLKVLEFSMSLMRGSDEAPAGYHGVVRDVTGRRRAEEALRESEEKYRTVVDNSLSGIFIYQEDIVIFANASLASTMGYDRPEDLVGRPFWEYVHLEDRDWVRERGRARSRGEDVPSHYHVRFLTKSGGTIWVDMQAALISYLGKPAVLGHAVDVTESRRLAEQLSQAQKLEAVGTLASGIAHDFNNLLQVISGYVQLMKPGEPVPSGKLEGMNHAIGQASGLVKRLMTLSRRARPEMTPLDLNRQVTRAMELLERTIPKMIALETRLADDLPAVNADPGQLEQLLINLGANARDAMPDGGRLVVETRNIHLGDDFCRVHAEGRPGDYVLLRISDTGSGMDETTMAHIFEPFFTTKGVGEGTGLGLFTAYGIVKAHGGVMTVDSRPGEGTAFQVYLPALPITPEAIDGKTEIEAEVPGGRELILLVDDEKAILDIAGEALRNHGYRTIAAANGEMAIETYRAYAGEVALVVLDLGMPGMGGLNCLKQLKQLDPQARILVASGYSSEGLSRDVVEAGAMGYVGKPYKIADFLSRVRGVLDDNNEKEL